MKNEKEYNDILSLVTHDLKSPMTAVLGAFELLSFDDLSKKDRQSAIKQGRKASKSILSLIENILVMAKLEAGKEFSSFEAVKDLNGHFEDMINTFKYEAKLKQITIKTKIEDNLPSVNWDIQKIHYHVINNIVSNALKFTYEDGKVNIKVWKKDKYINIKIQDNGIGISEDKQKDIFKKYETHDNKKVFKGNGLGLYNAFNFITQHNGSINIIEGLESKGIGFLITLPIDPKNNCN